MNLTYNGFVNVCKKAYKRANNSNVKRVYEAFSKIIENFPEITENEKGYIITTIGDFLERKNSKSWMIENAKKTGEYNKKGIFGLSCVKTGKNQFTGKPILTTPELIYLK